MTILEVDPRTDLGWHRLVTQEPSDVFHAPEWVRVLADTYEFDTRALLVVDEAGRPRAGVPYCPIRDLRGSRLVTLPFSDYCDPLVAEPAHWDAMLEQLCQHGSPYLCRCLHNDLPAADKRCTVTKLAHWHAADLTPDLEGLWRRLDESARRAIRKAEKAGVTVQVAEDEKLLRAFYDLHLGVRKFKYRLLAQPYRMFEKVWQHFLAPGKGRLIVASLANQVIAGAVFLEWRDRLYYKFGASDPTELCHRPNDLIIWEAMKHAKAVGLRTLDLGLSDWDQSGLVRYKRKFATEEKTIRFLRGASGVECEPAPVPRLLHELTALLTDPAVPDHVSETAGGLLYRYFA
jgi:CelD/BcsL family acetyltransferase involved in cellulose biosynthesis